MPRDLDPGDRDAQPDVWHSGRVVEISEAGLDFVKVLKCIHCGAVAPYETLCIPRREKIFAWEEDLYEQLVEEDIGLPGQYNPFCDCMDCKSRRGTW
jgi:hypothetical protein